MLAGDSRRLVIESLADHCHEALQLDAAHAADCRKTRDGAPHHVDTFPGDQEHRRWSWPTSLFREDRRKVIQGSERLCRHDQSS
jgi:hypothetical protein